MKTMMDFKYVLIKDIKLPTNDPKNPRNVGNVHWLGLLITRKVKKLYSFSSIKEISPKKIILQLFYVVKISMK